MKFTPILIFLGRRAGVGALPRPHCGVLPDLLQSRPVPVEEFTGPVATILSLYLPAFKPPTPSCFSHDRLPLGTDPSPSYSHISTSCSPVTISTISSLSSLPLTYDLHPQIYTCLSPSTKVGGVGGRNVVF